MGGVYKIPYACKVGEREEGREAWGGQGRLNQHEDESYIT